MAKTVVFDRKMLGFLYREEKQSGQAFLYKNSMLKLYDFNISLSPTDNQAASITPNSEYKLEILSLMLAHRNLSPLV